MGSGASSGPHGSSGRLGMPPPVAERFERACKDGDSLTVAEILENAMRPAASPAGTGRGGSLPGRRRSRSPSSAAVTHLSSTTPDSEGSVGMHGSRSGALLAAMGASMPNLLGGGHSSTGAATNAANGTAADGDDIGNYHSLPSTSTKSGAASAPVSRMGSIRRLLRPSSTKSLLDDVADLGAVRVEAGDFDSDAEGTGAGAAQDTEGQTSASRGSPGADAGQSQGGATAAGTAMPPWLTSVFASRCLLQATAHETNVEVVDMLVKHCRPVLDAVNVYGNSSLHNCTYVNTASSERIRDQRVKVSQLLLLAGASPDLVNRDGLTPLALACTQENRQMCSALARNGASIWALHEWIKASPTNNRHWLAGVVLCRHAFANKEFADNLQVKLMSLFGKRPDGTLNKKEMRAFIEAFSKVSLRSRRSRHVVKPQVSEEPPRRAGSAASVSAGEGESDDDGASRSRTWASDTEDTKAGDGATGGGDAAGAGAGFDRMSAEAIWDTYGINPDADPDETVYKWADLLPMVKDFYADIWNHHRPEGVPWMPIRDMVPPSLSRDGSTRSSVRFGRTDSNRSSRSGSIVSSPTSSGPRSSPPPSTEGPRDPISAALKATGAPKQDPQDSDDSSSGDDDDNEEGRGRGTGGGSTGGGGGGSRLRRGSGERVKVFRGRPRLRTRIRSRHYKDDTPTRRRARSKRRRSMERHRDKKGATKRVQMKALETIPEAVEEVKVEQWHVAPGDYVLRNDPLLSVTVPHVSTDGELIDGGAFLRKSPTVTTINAQADGVVQKLHFESGEAAARDAPIVDMAVRSSKDDHEPQAISIQSLVRGHFGRIRASKHRAARDARRAAAAEAAERAAAEDAVMGWDPEGDVGADMRRGSDSDHPDRFGASSKDDDDSDADAKAQAERETAQRVRELEAERQKLKARMLEGSAAVAIQRVARGHEGRLRADSLQREREADERMRRETEQAEAAALAEEEAAREAREREAKLREADAGKEGEAPPDQTPKRLRMDVLADESKFGSASSGLSSTRSRGSWRSQEARTTDIGLTDFDSEVAAATAEAAQEMAASRVRRQHAREVKRRLRNAAATRVQAVVRGRTTRARVAPMQEQARADYAQRDRAASMIGSQIRGRTTRVRLVREREYGAATRIQSLVRGNRGRHMAMLIRDEAWRPDREERERAAVYFQNIFRARRARQRLNDLRVQLRDMIAARRAKHLEAQATEAARPDFEQRNKAAQFLQRVYKGHVARMRFDNLVMQSVLAHSRAHTPLMSPTSLGSDSRSRALSAGSGTPVHAGAGVGRSRTGSGFGGSASASGASEGKRADGSRTGSVSGSGRVAAIDIALATSGETRSLGGSVASADALSVPASHGSDGRIDMDASSLNGSATGAAAAGPETASGRGQAGADDTALSTTDSAGSIPLLDDAAGGTGSGSNPSLVDSGDGISGSTSAPGSSPATAASSGSAASRASKFGPPPSVASFRWGAPGVISTVSPRAGAAESVRIRSPLAPKVPSPAASSSRK